MVRDGKPMSAYQNFLNEFLNMEFFVFAYTNMIEVEGSAIEKLMSHKRVRTIPPMVQI